jgi:hypothetical protein
MPSKYHLRDFQEGHYYHLYNASGDHKELFLNHQDYQTFIDILSYYLTNPHGIPRCYVARFNKQRIKTLSDTVGSTLSKLLSFCLLPNCFNLILYQGSCIRNTNTLSNLMKRICVSYTMYFNRQHKHSGTIFQGKFKSVEIIGSSTLVTLTKYIHLKPTRFYSNIKASDYPYSSYPLYKATNGLPWLDKETILRLYSQMHPQQEYFSFVEDKIDLPASLKPFLFGY